jgi:hypothetical protein
MIDAEHVVFPVRSSDLNAFTLRFTTPAERARRFIAGDAFEPVVGPDGTTEVLLALHEYASGDWGSLNAVNLCVLARPVGWAGDDGLFMIEAPIDEPFGNEASYRAMGIPRRFGEVGVAWSDGDVEFRVVERGRSTLTVRLRRRVPPCTWVSLARHLYTYVDRVPLVVPLDIGFPTEVLDPSDVDLELGEGPLADTLRAFGLPDRQGLCTWGEGLPVAFHLPSPLTRSD